MKLSWNIFMAVVSQLRYTRKHLGGQEAIHVPMRRWRGRVSTNPRDKFYALLGLISDTHVGIEPDYSLTKKAVYKTSRFVLYEKPDRFTF